MDGLFDWDDREIQTLCKAGFGAAGAAVGLAVASAGSGLTGGAAAPVLLPAGLLQGAALGLSAGVLACPYLTREKVESFLRGQPLSRRDAVDVLDAIGRVGGLHDKQEVLRAAQAMQQAWAARGAPLPAQTAGSPMQHARQLLRLVPATA